MPDYETFEHDVLVIGSGRRGSACGYRSFRGRRVASGMVCKCLLGKAHTVMAEGGIAAALANVDDRDNWKVHFADTMRGGQYVNNGEWRSCTPKKRPIACANSKHGAPCSIAQKTVAFCKEILADINIRGWRMWAIAPAWK